MFLYLLSCTHARPLLFFRVYLQMHAGKHPSLALSNTFLLSITFLGLKKNIGTKEGETSQEREREKKQERENNKEKSTPKRSDAKEATTLLHYPSSSDLLS